MKAIDEAKIKEKLALISQWRQSGQRLTPWCHAQGLEQRKVLGWLAYASRWQAKLTGHTAEGFKPVHVRPKSQPTSTRAPAGAAPTVMLAAPTAQPAIRIESASHPWIVHWPISHASELLALLGVVKGQP